ncbi:GtrA family protein [Nitriliruptor alkaliphilus]|uniref:GtrA family protein n=1 Tax=Nitriliruptor alkaliphilus TaxID=427918 RepID=UPI001470728A|nr:GtrA family protein [Nitriliruptor alkaliphilus]
MATSDPSAPDRASGFRRLSDVRRLVRYVIAGSTAAGSHLATLTLLVELGGLRPLVASTVGFGVGLVVSYTLQRRWVFASLGRHRTLLPRFLTVIAVALLLNTVVVHLGTEVLTVHYALVQLVAFGLIPLNNYVLNSLWTFR